MSLIMLMALKSYLQQVGQVSLADLAQHFGIQESAMEGMMNTWVLKGYVSLMNKDKCAITNCNKGCCSSGNSQIIYQWCGKQQNIKCTFNL